METLPILDAPLINLLNITLGLSLNDDYWIVPEWAAGLQWEDYNLYQNEFSETLALVAFTGYGDKVNNIVSSPEYTTDGMLRKCWRQINNQVYLYKAGSEGAANAGREPYSEYSRAGCSSYGIGSRRL